MLSEREVVYKQLKWIEKNLGKDFADSANVGWFVDGVNHTYSTKVYGERAGVLTTDMETGETTWTEKVSLSARPSARKEVSL